ncbi:MAG: serine hydroxymethyltransferase [Pseudomonadota bacterium]
MSREPRHGEIYLEFRSVGQQVKVTAIDATTGIEVSAVGPASAAQEDLKRIAVRKLQRRLEQEVANTSTRTDTNLY